MIFPLTVAAGLYVAGIVREAVAGQSARIDEVEAAPPAAARPSDAPRLSASLRPRL